MMEGANLKILTGLGISAFLIGYWFWPYVWFREGLFYWYWYDFFYQCLALGLVLIFFVLWKVTKWEIAEIGFWFTVNNALDEFFFNPTKVQLNEFIFGIAVILLITYKWKKKQRKRGYKEWGM